MRIRRVEVVPYRIPLRRPLRTAQRWITERAGLLIRLHGEHGGVGIGEAAPHPTAAPELLDDARAAIAAIDASELHGLDHVDAVTSALARVGLEMAWYDLAARTAGVGVAELLGSARCGAVPLNALIDAHAPEHAAQAARACVAQGFRCLKLKVMADDVAAESARLAAIRDAVGAEVRIRLDANGAWTVRDAIAAIQRLAVYGIEYIEQPVTDITALAQVRRAVRVPIAADESVTDAEAVAQLAAAQAADVVIVKPALLGLRAAQAVIRRARACGLDVVITSLLETSVGIAAALQVAATLPDPIRPCGLATAGLLAGDLTAASLAVRNGWMSVPEQPGLGVTLDDAALTRWRAG